LLAGSRPQPGTCTLISTPLVRVVDMRCHAEAGPPGAEEVADVPRFVVPRRGVFSWHARGRAHLVGPNRLLWFAPGEPYRLGHPVGGGDDCLSLSLTPALWAELADRVGLPAHRTANAVVPLPAATSFRGEALVRAARDESACRVGELALLFAAELAMVLAGGAGPAPRRRAAGQEDLAQQAVAFVAAHYREPIPRLLDAAAVAVRCSPFHLARVFRSEVGSTMYAFRERLRQADALRAVAGGVTSLSTLANRLGYASHSHLTHNFSQAYGLPPGAARKTFSGPAEELRRILEAAAGEYP
jgi:AraC-like DNA-binding protein